MMPTKLWMKRPACAPGEARPHNMGHSWSSGPRDLYAGDMLTLLQLAAAAAAAAEAVVVVMSLMGMAGGAPALELVHHPGLSFG